MLIHLYFVIYLFCFSFSLLSFHQSPHLPKYFLFPPPTQNRIFHTELCKYVFKLKRNIIWKRDFIGILKSYWFSSVGLFWWWWRPPSSGWSGWDGPGDSVRQRWPNLPALSGILICSRARWWNWKWKKNKPDDCVWIKTYCALVISLIDISRNSQSECEWESSKLFIEKTFTTQSWTSRLQPDLRRPRSCCQLFCRLNCFRLWWCERCSWFSTLENGQKGDIK